MPRASESMIDHSINLDMWKFEGLGSNPGLGTMVLQAMHSSKKEKGIKKKKTNVLDNLVGKGL